MKLEYYFCSKSRGCVIRDCQVAFGWMSWRSHVSPEFLEKYEPREDDDDFELLMTASDLLRCRGELGFLLHYYNVYKEKCNTFAREVRNMIIIFAGQKR